MNGKKKVCPLMGAGPLGVDTDCKEGRCAWWDGCGCAMLGLAVSFGWLNNNGITTWVEKEDT